MKKFLTAYKNAVIKKNITKLFESKNIKYKSIEVFSTPTRLTLLINDLPTSIKTQAKEIRGPKIGVPKNILEGFMKSHQVKNRKDVFEKKEEKGNFYYIKKEAKKNQAELDARYNYDGDGDNQCDGLITI